MSIFFTIYTSKRHSTPICNLLAIYHFYSDTDARDNSRESRKGSGGAMVLHPRAQSRPPFSFVLHSFGFRPDNHVATLRISAANSPLFPVNAPTKSSVERTPDYDRREPATTITPTRVNYREF